MYTCLLQLCSGAVDGCGVSGIRKHGGGGEREEICVNALMVLGRNFLGQRDNVCEFYFLSLFVFFLIEKKIEPQFVNPAMWEKAELLQIF
jgi:hypothetical protein